MDEKMKNLDSLEREAGKMPSEFRNQYIVELENGDKAVYDAIVAGFYLDDQGGRAVYELRKYLVKRVRTKEHVRIGLFSRKEIEVEKNKTTKDWKLGSPEVHRDFLSDENLIFSYRADLKRRAYSERGLIISDELLDKTFGPIEQKILEFYNKIYLFGKEPKQG